MIGFTIGVFLGFMIGVVVMSLLVISKENRN